MESLQALIYGGDDSNSTNASESMDTDTNRYDSNASKLQSFKHAPFKKLLKKKFVTGMSKDKILENLMNQSDSDNEIDKNAKDQLR